MPTDNFFSRRRVVVAAAVGLAAVVVTTGVLSRQSQTETLREGVAASSLPTVKLVVPSALAGGSMELPGRLEAWSRAPIHARVSGYLKRWTVDIGGSVKAGQLLAEIETPELDQQLTQAQAELATAHSSAALAASTAKRWQALLATDSVSRQEADERAGDLEAKRSVVSALQANVDRVQSLKHDSRLLAPFDGVVTARNTDTGALINVGGAAGSELFVVSDLRRLRVYASVPQRQVAAIRVGSKAQLTVPERPSQRYTATVQSLARAIESGSGAMLVQLTVDNDTGDLLPGGFATLRFDAVGVAGGLGVPPSALIFGKEGVQVATVEGDGLVQLRPVTVARDYGNVVELASGLERGARVVDSPPDGLAEGDRVRVAATPTGAAP